IPTGVKEYSLREVESASIVLIVEGMARNVRVSPSVPEASAAASQVQRGSVIFLGAGQNMSFELDDTSKFLAFRALCII
ncbi:hypothetical protein SK128_018552, partial [Halocaridina rubra]